MHDLVNLCRCSNASKRRRAIVNDKVLEQIKRDRPAPRMGRMQFYRAVAADLGVSVSAITTAMQRRKS